MSRLRFTKVREVKSPNRAHPGDAGLDFYIPRDLHTDDLRDKNPDGHLVQYVLNTDNTIKSIRIQPHGRVLIPSGIRVLLEPVNSMLMAANKSGNSTNKGIVYSAEIIDTPYVGEMGIGIINTSDQVVEFKADDKPLQFIHVPIHLTEPEEISPKEYEAEAKDWGTRGTNGFGSTDNK